MCEEWKEFSFSSLIVSVIYTKSCMSPTKFGKTRMHLGSLWSITWFHVKIAELPVITEHWADDFMGEKMATISKSGDLGTSVFLSLSLVLRLNGIALR